MKTILAAAFLLATTIFALADDVPAPQAVVIVACRVDDLTGQPGRQDPALAAKDWRDLELHVNKNLEYDCKREVVELQDQTQFASNAPDDLIPLQPNFGDWAQCAHVGVMQAQAWNQKHPGWGVVAVGCPTKIVNDDGRIVSWVLPSCPTYVPGTENRMRCNFDSSLI